MSKNNEKNEIEIELEVIKQSEKNDKLGEVVGADTDDVIEFKILRRPDEIKVGQPLVIDTDIFLYYSMITRLYYPKNSVAERFANSPFTGLIPSSQIEGVRGKEFYGMADLNCLKLIPKSLLEMKIGEKKDISEIEDYTREFDTIPPIFSIGRAVEEKEINIIYLKTEYSSAVGTLRGFEHEIPINIAQLVKKPYGLFGRTGIGKSILNKLLCLNILKHNVSQLILFDMQGEYGLHSRADGTCGLKFFFQEKIQIYRLGELGKKEKVEDGAENFFMYKDNITAGDIIASSQTLQEPTINVLYQIEKLARKKKSNLLDEIKTIDPKAHDLNKHSVGALKNRISRFEGYKFLKD